MSGCASRVSTRGDQEADAIIDNGQLQAGVLDQRLALHNLLEGVQILYGLKDECSTALAVLITHAPVLHSPRNLRTNFSAG